MNSTAPETASLSCGSSRTIENYGKAYLVVRRLSGSKDLLTIEIQAIGRDKENWITDGVAHYQKLLGKFARVTITVLNQKRDSSSLSPKEIRKIEAALFNQKPNKGITVALSDKGKSVDSPAMAKLLEELMTRSNGHIRFLIGGPYGLDDELTAKADLILSLSPLTFSHQLVRLVLLEQLFRAFSILRGDPYHK